VVFYFHSLDEAGIGVEPFKYPSLGIMQGTEIAYDPDSFISFNNFIHPVFIRFYQYFLGEASVFKIFILEYREEEKIFLSGRVGDILSVVIIIEDPLGVWKN